jgi:NAD(P)-dependent dehydrogenase (short-subunit alcohol dehydrogenase family)
MMNLRGSRILVAGGTGHVGRHLVNAIVEGGGTAIVPSRSSEKLDWLIRANQPDHRDQIVPLTGNISNPREGAALMERAAPLHGAVVAVGTFVQVCGVLGAAAKDLQRALDGYVAAHFAVARTVIPILEPAGGAYVMINGPLAFQLMSSDTALVSIATAAQAMLARVLMKELAQSAVRVNEVVIYSRFGCGHDDRNAVIGADVSRYVTRLLSTEGAGVRGQRIHLRWPEQARIPIDFADAPRTMTLL